jgi:hypothetical protein
MDNKKLSSSGKNKGFTSSTSASDHALFKKLGLVSFTDIPSNTEYFVGEVSFNNGSKVKIWVHPMPAQFWKIEVFIAQSKKVAVISTGSGALSDFWDTVRLIADGMLDIVYKK